jgi:phosphatidylglycerophosphatase A
MAIAECIGGTYARFEFTRYDQKKPGILAKLGPFLDDAVAGLIAGCTSRLYSECV